MKLWIDTDPPPGGHKPWRVVLTWLGILAVVGLLIWAGWRPI